MSFSIRSATQDDLDILWRFLAIAADLENAAVAKAMPSVAAHLVGWKRPGDFGFIAEQNGKPAGAIKARQFRPDEPGMYIDDATPEASIAVLPEARGRGTAQALLTALIAEANGRGVRLSTVVRDSNAPALRLYQRAGFEIMPEKTIPSRAGGLSLALALPI